MDLFYLLALVPFIGIVSPIYLSFDQTIEPINKILLFLFLPAIEGLFILVFILETLSNKTNAINTWKPSLIALLIIIGLSLTLIVTLVENLNSKVKLAARLTALSILSFVIVWGIASQL